jgi:hypothetical protein
MSAVMKKNKTKKEGGNLEAVCTVKSVFGTVLGLLFVGAGVMLIFSFWYEAITVLKGLSGVVIVLCGAAIIAVLRD